MQTIQNEIVDEVPLCDDRGRLNPAARGWSRKPLHVCNLRGRFPRKKKWDYWCITGDRFLFSATIAHVDYFALGNVYALEYASGAFAEQTAVRPFPREPRMPETVHGDIQFAHRGLEMSFQQISAGLRMLVHSDRFGGKRLDAELTIDRSPAHETLNVVVPWNDRTFQFTSKQHCLPARGIVTWGDWTFKFEPGGAFACLDFGRGIWPYRTVWNWASFSGRAGDDVVGLNMGAQWTDHTGMNENGIVLNGRLHKIFDDIVFTYDRKDFKRPWKMATATSDTVDLTFTPFYEKAGRINLLLLKAEGHQMFGHYSGTLIVDGRALHIDRQIGWAEEHVARW